MKRHQIGEPGQGIVEYALILVLIVVVVIIALVLLGPSLDDIFTGFMDGLVTS